MSGVIPMEHGLLLAALLFALGLAGLVLRRNMLFMLMSAEIMMNATALAFVVAGARWGAADGQVMFVLVLSLQAAEACVGLALVIQLYRRFRTLDVDTASTMKG
jgi:NADH-quinone oxidoreductase subunit K